MRRCQRKFLRFFPRGFHDPTYDAWERGYKWLAHRRWQEELSPEEYRRRLRQRRFGEVAAHAVRVESRTNLLFSFEKMALRDAVRGDEGAEAFARGLHQYLYGRLPLEERFGDWVEAVGRLPRRQTRVLTWPVLTVFPFIAEPRQHVFLKPGVMRRAAEACGFEFQYASRPGWETYASLLAFAAAVQHALTELQPRDMIDVQSFLWVQGSDEYD